MKSALIKKGRFKKFSFKHLEYKFVASSVSSSNIEGVRMDINSFYRNRDGLFRRREVREIESLVDAYKFAYKNKLTQKNFLRAHAMLSKNLVPPSFRGKFRKEDVVVIDSRDVIIYTGIQSDLIHLEMDKLFHDIQILLNAKLNEKEIFYYASMIHAHIAKIHPFRDGNGRSARLIEKWFLASKIGDVAWTIPSEKFYWGNIKDYYGNLGFGLSYDKLEWEDSINLLLMLPKSLS